MTYPQTDLVVIPGYVLRQMEHVDHTGGTRFYYAVVRLATEKTIAELKPGPCVAERAARYVRQYEKQQLGRGRP